MKKIDELKRQKRIHGLNEDLTEKEIKMFEKGFPIQKIIGFINFDNLKININHNVLIPRYETEEVVREALKYINKDSKVLDLCCGSGYIGLTIKQKTNANVTLSDVDNEAILQTIENAKFNKLDVKIIKSDLFSKINKKFDVIISNPPYISSNTILPKKVTNYEPCNALLAGADGNNFYRKIISKINYKIQKGGYIIFEISPENSKFLLKMGFKIIQDINEKDRIAIKKII